MNLNDLLHDIHILEDELRVYERKYAMLSDVFYAAYRDGEEPPDDTWVRDWTAWASGYEVLQDLREQYRAAIVRLQAEDQSVANVMTRTARHEVILVPV
jgi:hypothetical protein